MKWYLWAHERPNGTFTEIGDKRLVELYHFNFPIVQVILEESGTGMYWGWIRAGKQVPTMIYPSRVQFSICFPGGYEKYEQLGDGRHVRLNVRRK